VATGESLEKHLEAIDPDVQLMLRVRAGDHRAYETLVERYQHRLLGVLTHLIGRQDEAEDLTQEVFLRIYKARKRYKPRARFSTWLFTVANNLAMNHLRGKRRNPVVPWGGGSTASSGDRPAGDTLPARDGTASAQMRRIELSEVVRQAVESLNEDQRMAVLLNKFEDLSYAEIAEIMGRSEAAIKSLLARARVNLRGQLEPYLQTGRLS
jgi:RNA polymerase sigma-70 factor (ECF subfamily)